MSNKTKFTAGPWRINEYEPTEIRGCGAGNDWIAETHWMYSKRGKKITPKELANARLIAAAPDLLFALEKLRDVMQAHNDEQAAAMVQAALVIAKAKGE